MILWTLLAANAATLRVDADDGSAYPSISAAISAASSGDTVEIAAGTWEECLDTGGRSLTLRGVGDETILDSGACGWGLIVDNGEAVSLEDLSLTGSGARGIYAAYSTVSLTRVLLSGLGNGSAYGGALESYGSALHFTDCRFEGNTGLYGGALYVAWSSTLRDSGSTYTSNSAAGDGGAIYTYAYDTVTLSGVTMTDNVAAGGGGAWLAAWDSGITVEDSTFSGNEAGGNGGALYLYAVDPDATFSGTRFEANAAGGSGGALELEWYTSVALEDCALVGNTAASWGGAVFAYALDALSVTNSRLCANEAGYGGALGIQWTTQDTLRNSILVENSAVQGGALYRYASGAGVIENNTLVANTSSDWGSALYAGWYAYGTFTNNLVVSSGEGTGAYAADPYDHGYTTFTYDGWHDNDPQDVGGYFYASEDDGHVWGDPLFVGWSANGDCEDDDLRLGSGSPMRDAGDPAVLDPDGGRSDIGAWGGPGAPVEDQDGDGLDTTEDCDDTNAEISPLAAERCDGLDNDCDGEVDGEGAADRSAWYTDWDGDGYGDPATETLACEAPEGAVVDGTDCDDQNPYQSPGAEDLCEDGFDQDCSGEDAACEEVDAGEETGQDVADPEKSGGCGCAQGRDRTPGWGAALALLGLVVRRRARRARA